MPGIGDWFKKATEGAAGGFLNGAANIISKFVADPTAQAEALAELQKEQMKHDEEMLKIGLEADRIELEKEKALLADVHSARESNARIQDSDKASWMSKNVGYILDLSVALLFYSMLFMIFFVKIPQENKEIFYTAFGVLGAKYGSSFDFHRGSSAGSKASGDALRKMVNK